MSNYYLIAKLIAAIGDKGEIKIFPVSDYPERFYKLKTVFIDFWGDKKKFLVQYVKRSKRGIVIKFENFDDKNSVELLLGKDIFIDENNLIKLPKGHYFIHDIIGCKVFRNKNAFGEVVDVYKLQANDVFVIKKISGDEISIPAVKNFIEKVDIINRKIVLKPGGDIYEDDEN